MTLMTRAGITHIRTKLRAGKSFYWSYQTASIHRGPKYKNGSSNVSINTQNVKEAEIAWVGFQAV
jgi:hypothetical protein